MASERATSDAPGVASVMESITACWDEDAGPADPVAPVGERAGLLVALDALWLAHADCGDRARRHAIERIVSSVSRLLGVSYGQ